MTFIKNLLHRLKDLFNMVFKRSVYISSSSYEPVYASSETKDTAFDECASSSINEPVYATSENNDMTFDECEVSSSYEPESNEHEHDFADVTSTHECENDSVSSESSNFDINNSCYSESSSDVDNKYDDDYSDLTYDMSDKEKVFVDKFGFDVLYDTKKKREEYFVPHDNEVYRLFYRDRDELIKNGAYKVNPDNPDEIIKVGNFCIHEEYTHGLLETPVHVVKGLWSRIEKFMNDKRIYQEFALFDSKGNAVFNPFEPDYDGFVW